MTLSERISIKDGAVEQSNFYDYHLPRMNDVPEMHIELIRPIIIRPAQDRWRRR